MVTLFCHTRPPVTNTSREVPLCHLCLPFRLKNSAYSHKKLKKTSFGPFLPCFGVVFVPAVSIFVVTNAPVVPSSM